MSFKWKSLKLFFVVFILVLLLGTVGSILLRKYNEIKSPEKFMQKELVIQEQNEAFPRIENIPPRSIFLDSNFTFVPKIVPMDAAVKLSLLGSPDWLNLNDLVVRGTPDELGTFKFILRVERDGEYIDQEFYLIVIEDDGE